MALIANGVRFTQGNAYYMGGNATTSARYCAERATMWSPGARRRFAYGQASIEDVTNSAAVPEGYLHPTCWDMPQKGGGMASRGGRIVGAGDVTAANLAGGLNALADLAAGGDITNAALGLILSAVATLIGSGTLTADIVGKLEAVAALSGAGNTTAALGALASLQVSLSGAATESATLLAKASMSASIIVTGDVLNTANVADAVWDALAAGNYSYADLLRILAAVAAGKTTIVDLGGGMATVTFRDVNDTKNAVVADMDGSERTDVTLDGSE